MARRITQRLRATLLQWVFDRLYTQLGALHEPVGRLVYGAAWDGRRRHVVGDMRSGLLLDIGCGEGRLLRRLNSEGTHSVGIEPSPEMARRAHDRGLRVVRARAQALPFASNTVAQVIATYPGPWILDSGTWDEIARVCEDGATVTILLGGDIRRGRGALLRRAVVRIAYGRSDGQRMPPAIGHILVEGDYAFLEDQWGTAILWKGVRRSSSYR